MQRTCCRIQVAAWKLTLTPVPPAAREGMKRDVGDILGDVSSRSWSWVVYMLSRLGKAHMTISKQLGTLRRACSALMVHAAAQERGRYIRIGAWWPRSTNLYELWWSTS